MHCDERVSVCASMCLFAFYNFTKSFSCVDCGRDSVFLCRRCNTLRTSDFVDDVVFPCSGPNGGVMLLQQLRCNVVCVTDVLTPLLRCTGCVDRRYQDWTSPSCRGTVTGLSKRYIIALLTAVSLDYASVIVNLPFALIRRAFRLAFQPDDTLLGPVSI